jgi:hypothetical protein
LQSSRRPTHWSRRCSPRSVPAPGARPCHGSRRLRKERVRRASLCQHLVARDGLDLIGGEGIATANRLLQPQPLDLAFGQVLEAVEQVVGELYASGMVESEGLASEFVNGHRDTTSQRVN